MSFGIKFFT